MQGCLRPSKVLEVELRSATLVVVLLHLADLGELAETRILLIVVDDGTKR